MVRKSYEEQKRIITEKKKAVKKSLDGIYLFFIIINIFLKAFNANLNLNANNNIYILWIIYFFRT